MFTLSSLTDTSLRRIYKFVLKKVIGDYLEDELLIEQLEVKSREGRVILRDLALSASSINEYLQDSPMTVVSATVRELHALISYTTILTDGCTFTGHGVHIILAPNPHINHPRSKPVPSPDVATNVVPPADIDDDHILTYLAQWIEIVVARLQLKFEDVTIEIRDSADEATTTTGILFHFPKAVFYNTHPQQMRDSTVDSVSAAASMYTTHLLGNKKLVELLGVNIDVMNADTTRTHLLTSSDTLSAQILTRPNTKSLEIDVFSSQLRCSLQRTMIVALNRLACSFNEKSSNAKTETDISKSIAGLAKDVLRLKDNLYRFGQTQSDRDLDRMVASEDAAEDGVDLSRVAVLLKKYQAVREKLEAQSFEPKTSVWQADSGGYSSGEFPDSDGESIGSDDFVDASQGLDASRQAKTKREPLSAMNQSLYGAASVRFTDDVAASHGAQKSGMTIRLHVEEFYLFFQQQHSSSALEVRLDDIIINFDMMRLSENVVEPHFSLSIGSLLIAEAELISTDSGYERILVNSDCFVRFSHVPPAGNVSPDDDIIPSPHVDLTVAFTDGCMIVQTLMPHLVASLNVTTIQRWSSILNDIFPPTPTETSTLAINCSVTLSSVEVVMWCDCDSQPTAFGSWQHMASSLGLCAEPEWTNRRWMTSIHDCERYGVDCFGGTGGLRIVAHQLHGSLQSKAYRLRHPNNVPSTSQHTYAEAKEIQAFLRVPVPRVGSELPCHSELLFMSIQMTEDAMSQNHGVIVYKDKYAAPAPHSTDDGNDKFVVPEMNIKDIVVIHAQRVDVDLRQLELTALQAVTSALTPPLTGSSIAVKSTQPTVSGWGIRIISAVNTFHLSQDVCLSHETNSSSNGPMCFGLSIHDSRLEINADSTIQQKRLYFGLSAVDMSLFEMTLAQAASGCGLGRQCQGARFSDDVSGSHFSIPFLHRTSLQNHLQTSDGWEDLHFVHNIPYVAAAKVLVVEDIAPDATIDSPVMKNVAVFIDLHDVTYRYDPDSNWMTRLPELLSAPPSTIAKSSYHPLPPKDIPPIYGITRIHIRLQKVLIDYCQPSCVTSGAESRLLLRIGDMALKSTIVTNAPQLTLKVSVKDIAVRIANRLLRAAQFEQLPLDFRGQYCTGIRRNSALLDWDNFVDAHAFVLMGSIDYFDVAITLQSANSKMSQTHSVENVIPLSVDVNVSTGAFYGCADSLLVLAETVSTLVTRIKAKVAQEDDAENEDGIQIFSAQDSEIDMENRMLERSYKLPVTDTGIDNERSRTLRGKTITPKSNDSALLKGEEVPPLPSPQKTVLAAIDQSMFRPHQQTVPASARLSGASAPVDFSRSMNESTADISGGLTGAMIEGFYDKRTAESEPEPQEYQARWIPQYDYSDTEEEMSMSGFAVESKKDARGIPEDLISSDEENDDADDAPMPSSMWASWGGARIVKVQHEDREMTEMMGGGKRSPSTVDEDLDAEFEMDTPRAVTNTATTTTAPITSFPFLDPDAQRAWRTGDVDWHDLEEKAGWFSDLGVTSPKVLPYYVTETAQLSSTDTLDRGDGVYPKARFVLRLSLKLRVFDGLEWKTGPAVAADNDLIRKIRENEAAVIRRVFGELNEDTDGKKLFSHKKNLYLPPKATSATRSKGDMSEMSLHEVAIQFVMYPKNTATVSKPIQRLTVSIQDALLSYARAGKRRKKILGGWKNYQGPKSVETPLFNMTMDGYDLNSASTVALPESLEFRLVVRLMPIRCYLDGRYVEFVRAFATSISDISARNAKNDPDTKKDVESSAETHFFQFWHICPIEIKIDYHPLPVNLKALHSGDYLQVSSKLMSEKLIRIQLLNLFPIEGMEVKLTDVKATGVSGMGNGINLTLKEWVNEIYANQIHRIVSGAAIFRGLSSIGSGLQGMLLIPAQEYKKHGVAGALKGLQKGTMSLLRTVTNEALHATHQVTHFLATSLVDLVSPDGPSSSSRMTLRNETEGARQPVGFVDSLDRAYDSVARELHSTLDTVVAVPVKQYKRTGPGGFVKSVVRALPVAIIRPAAGTAEAISYTVLGLRNNLDPTRRRDEEDMWNVDHTLRPRR